MQGVGRFFEVVGAMGPVRVVGTVGVVWVVSYPSHLLPTTLYFIIPYYTYCPYSIHP